MAKNKEDKAQDHMKKGEELRASMIKEKKVKAVEPKEAFRKYFIRIKDKLKLSPNMESVLWQHLVATQNDKPENFVKGIENFGYKVN